MVSLIAATMNRVAELERLLASLDRQSYKDFELIVVDQNSDDRLAPVLRAHPSLTIRHLHCAPGASRARNVGLRAAQGDIIGFPDDDCWYPENLLATVTNWFNANPDFGGLFAILRSADNQPVGPKWPESSCLCTRETLWDRGITPIGFLRRQVTDAIGFFDERIGLGAPSQYQSGEDIDYFLRPFNYGFKMWHEPGITVHHPSFHAPERLRDRTYSYSLGGGYVMRAHGYPSRLLIRGLVRSAGGAVVNLLRGNLFPTRVYTVRAAGLLRGYVLGPRDLRKLENTAR
jgi:glycosyltransferase involved in cell wall biosynthesis